MSENAMDKNALRQCAKICAESFGFLIGSDGSVYNHGELVGNYRVAPQRLIAWISEHIQATNQPPAED